MRSWIFSKFMTVVFYAFVISVKIQLKSFNFFTIITTFRKCCARRNTIYHKRDFL